MAELPEVPFYFKTKFTGYDVFKCYKKDEEKWWYNRGTGNTFYRSYSDFENCFNKNKLWTICDKNGNEIKEKKMQYITRDKDYTGCPEEIAELLKQGKEIEGVFTDVCESEHSTLYIDLKGILADYIKGAEKKYVDIYGFSFDDFTPTPAKQSTTCVRTLIENGVDIPVDTKVYAIVENTQVKGHYAGKINGFLGMWENGKTKYSSNGQAHGYIEMYLLEPVEYTPKGE